MQQRPRKVGRLFDGKDGWRDESQSGTRETRDLGSVSSAIWRHWVESNFVTTAVERCVTNSSFFTEAWQRVSPVSYIPDLDALEWRDCSADRRTFTRFKNVFLRNFPKLSRVCKNETREATCSNDQREDMFLTKPQMLFEESKRHARWNHGTERFVW